MPITIRPQTATPYRPVQRVRFAADSGKKPGDTPADPPTPPAKKGWLPAFKNFPMKARLKHAISDVGDLFRWGPTESGRNLKLFLRSMTIHVAWISLFSTITSLGAVIPALPALLPIYAGVSASYQVVDTFMRGLFNWNEAVQPKDRK